MRSMPRALVALFACACGVSVANVYYAQPLLDALALDFAISHAAVGGVITATQAGSALALLLLVPLGDVLPRRGLMLGQLTALVAALAAVCMAHTAAGMMAGMLAVGMLGTAMTQGLIAYAASAAQDGERGRVVGAAQSGVLAGLLLARVFAGLIADQAGWRGVYGASALMMLALGLLLWRALPPGPSLHAASRPEAAMPTPAGTAGTASNAATARPAASMRQSYLGAYWRLLGSMLMLLRHNRVLRVRGVIGLLMFAVFSSFWSALVFLLSAPPYQYTHTTIGAFGLAGLAGALAATRAGHWADQGRAQHTSAAALASMFIAWLPLALGSYSLTALITGILLLDFGVQALHVANQSLILQTGEAAHSRLIGAYMMFYAIGSGAGALAATAAYDFGGWIAVCVLGASLSLAAAIFWITTKWPVRIAKVAGPI